MMKNSCVTGKCSGVGDKEKISRQLVENLEST
jgi:hypothetical protein